MNIDNININFDREIIYKDFHLNIKEGKINCIMGRSGCGKTVLLNNLGLYFLKAGYKVSYIFQDPCLIKWRNVYKNLEMVLPSSTLKKENEEKIQEVLDLVELKDYKKSFPSALSGGMRQRVNIARALIYPSEILIMDEPFKSLDIYIKNKIIRNILEKNKKDKKTIIFVTHDIDEGLEYGEEIMILGNRPVEIKAQFSSATLINKEQVIKILGI